MNIEQISVLFLTTFYACLTAGRDSGALMSAAYGIHVGSGSFEFFDTTG
ncbi:MAG: hypothetical protein ABGX07_05630 [Pirellulaceae bacterium]